MFKQSEIITWYLEKFVYSSPKRAVHSPTANLHQRVTVEKQFVAENRNKKWEISEHKEQAQPKALPKAQPKAQPKSSASASVFDGGAVKPLLRGNDKF